MSGTLRTLPARQRLRESLAWILCGLLVTAIIFTASRDKPRSHALVETRAEKTILTLPNGTSINWRGTKDTWSKLGFSRLLALSRDGRRMIFTLQERGQASLYLKDEDDFLPRKVAGTDRARAPFLSPDGQWLGFLVENELQKVQTPCVCVCVLVSMCVYGYHCVHAHSLNLRGDGEVFMDV